MTAAVARVLKRPGALRSALPPDTGRRVVMGVLVVALLASLYLFVIRDSALVAIDDVRVTGLTSQDSAQIRAAIEAEARDMTTLHVRDGDLKRAVEGFPVVRALEVRADFPSGLRVHVIEHRPAAFIQSGSAKVPVAADGSVLRGLPVAASLPRIDAGGAISADQIRDQRLLGLLRVAGAAPGPLARRMQAITKEKERGIVVALKDGPELVFGTPAAAAQKWIAAARVLADETSRGAAYVDLRLPERPAAGGVVEEAPVTPVEPVPAAPVAPVEPAPTEPQL